MNRYYRMCLKKYSGVSENGRIESTKKPCFFLLPLERLRESEGDFVREIVRSKLPIIGKSKAVG